MKGKNIFYYLYYYIIVLILNLHIIIVVNYNTSRLYFLNYLNCLIVNNCNLLSNIYIDSFLKKILNIEQSQGEK